MNTISKSVIGKESSGKFPPAVRGRRNGSRRGATFAAVVAAALVGYAGAAMGGMALVVETGVALVIGNDNYEDGVGVLATARNDAVAVGAAFERLGFTVTRIEDASYVDMLRGLLEFTQAAQSAPSAVVFYAGHGQAVADRNFLVPVDWGEEAFERGEDVTTLREAELGLIPLRWVIRSVEGTSGFRLVILDGDVLMPLEPGEPGEGTLVALGAKVGSHPYDGGAHSDNSPYTEALLRYLEEPVLDLGMMFRRVRADVLRETNGSQEPAVYGSLPPVEIHFDSPRPPALER